MSSRRAQFALVLALALAGAPASRGAEGEIPGWAEILATRTAPTSDLPGVAVDYAALRHDPSWPAVPAALARIDPASLPTRAARIAFWLNAYNVLAIDTVVRHYPLESIRDAGSFLFPVWKAPAGRIGARSYSLDEIEHRELRPLGDPRIHLALVCASRSCPALRREPYTGERLDAQLDAAARDFLADPRKGLALDATRAALRLSPIFQWFDEDFERSGGVLAFVGRYAPPDAAAWIAAHPDAEVAYFDYDWRLNAPATPGAPR